MTEVELDVNDDGVSVSISDDSEGYSVDRTSDLLTRACDTAVRLFADTLTLRLVREQEADDGS